MTYINLYSPDINPGHTRAVDLDSRHTPYAPVVQLDLSSHFGDRQLDKDEFEAHLRDAAALVDGVDADALATEFALILASSLEEGWDTDHRTRFLGPDCGGRTALLAHAIAHPNDWSAVIGRRVGREGRESYYTALRERGGRLVIVGYDAYAREHSPLSRITKHASPELLWVALFAMLPAIAEYMAAEPADEAWGAPRLETLGTCGRR